jgi:signal transduction histidine kinase
MSVSRQQVYIAAIGAIGLLVVSGSLFALPADPLVLLLFCLLAAAAEWTTATLLQVRQFSIELSIASAVSFAAALIFAPAHAGLVGAVGGVTAAVISARRQSFTLRRAAEVLTFNAGMNALATYVGAIVFQSLHGGPLSGALALGDLPALLTATIADDLVNAVALVVMIAIQWGQKPFTIWRENFAWAAPINVATMTIGGGALATGFGALGLTGLLVFFLPVFLSVYAFRAYITRTQAMMAHLEEMVQERTADLAKANESLHELHRQKDAFFAVITHDMRSPLTSMLGFTELLEGVGAPGEEVKPFLAAIKRNTEALMDMVNNILDLSRLDSGQMEYRRAPLSLAEIVGDVLTNIEGYARARAIALRGDIGETQKQTGDADKLRRLVTNLVSNAIKYTREGGQVLVGLHQADGSLQLSVRDTGIGIPADQLPHIFERFRRVRRPGGTDAAGTGLGLAIVKEFAQAHGGRVDVESTEGVGSTFTVTLPLV